MAIQTKNCRCFPGKDHKHKFLAIFLTAGVIAVSILGLESLDHSSFLDKIEKDSQIVLTDQFITKILVELLLSMSSFLQNGRGFQAAGRMSLMDKMQKTLSQIAQSRHSFLWRIT